MRKTKKPLVILSKIIYDEYKSSPGCRMDGIVRTIKNQEVTIMRGYELAQILKEKGITVEDVASEIAYRKETNALSNNPQNEAFNDMTLSQLLRIKEMWDI